MVDGCRVKEQSGGGIGRECEAGGLLFSFDLLCLCPFRRTTNETAPLSVQPLEKSQYSVVKERGRV